MLHTLRGLKALAHRPLAPCYAIRLSSTTPGTSFSAVPVSYDEIVRIKQDRFGHELERFKTEYEAPIFQQFSAVKEVQRRLSNRQSRHQMKKPKAKKSTLSARERFDRRERRIEAGLQEFILHDKTNPDLLLGRTAKERARRETFLNGILGGTFWERHTKLAEYTPENPPPGVQANPLSNWSWEKTLDHDDLVKIVSKEMEREALPLDWANYHRVRNRVKEHSEEDRVTQVHLSPLIGVAGRRDSDRVAQHPALLNQLPDVTATRLNRRDKLTKVSDQHPIAFETTHYPLNSKMYSPYRTRRVTLYVKVSALNLPPPVRERFIALTEWSHEQKNVLKPRYNKDKKILTLTSRSARTLQGNRRNVISKLKKLLEEAWKADLNYIPPSADFEMKSLLPHEVIEKEIKDGHQLAQKAEALSFERVKERAAAGMAFFRLSPTLLRPLEELDHDRKKTQELVNRLRKDL